MIKFRRHAIKRIRERLNISPEQVRDLLEQNKDVPIGVHGKTKLTHRLFYSKPDNNFFVAVHDLLTNEIITVLYFNYHNAWSISMHARDMAKDLACRGDVVIKVPKPLKIPKPPEVTPPKKFYLCYMDARSKRCTIHRWDNVANISAEEFISSPDFRIELLIVLSTVGDSIHPYIFLQVGKNGPIFKNLLNYVNNNENVAT